MAKMTVCPICGKVTKAKKFGVIRFLILLGFGIVPGILYVLWYAIKGTRCMHCGVKF